MRRRIGSFRRRTVELRYEKADAGIVHALIVDCPLCLESRHRLSYKMQPAGYDPPPRFETQKNMTDSALTKIRKLLLWIKFFWASSVSKSSFEVSTPQL